MSRKVSYIRVSTTDQNTDRQHLEGMDRVFEERLSGKNRERPELDRMLDFIWEGDTVYVHSIDRLARNLQDLLDLVQTITGKGCRLIFVKENLTFGGDDNIYAELQLQMMGAFASFERKLSRSRQAEGIAKRKQRLGDQAYTGRKASIDPNEVVALLDQGFGPTEVAHKLGISRQSVYRLAKAA